MSPTRPLSPSLHRDLLRRAVVRVALAMLLLAAAQAPAVRAAEGAPVERRYTLRFIQPNDALAVAQNLCPTEGTCTVAVSSGREISVLAERPVHERIATALQAADVPPASQAFLLILLQASAGPAAGGAALPAGLPPDARKAIEDLASFLPYGRFELLAPVSFLRTTRNAEITVGGDDELAYELALSFRGDPRQPGAELLVDAFRLRRVPAEPMLIALAQQPGFGPGATLPRRGAQDGAPAGQPAPSGGAKPAPGAAPSAPTPPPTVAEDLLATTFSIRKGETVVVGTSKLHGNDQALVVLLTALP